MVDWMQKKQSWWEALCCHCACPGPPGTPGCPGTDGPDPDPSGGCGSRWCWRRNWRVSLPSCPSVLCENNSFFSTLHVLFLKNCTSIPYLSISMSEWPTLQVTTFANHTFVTTSLLWTDGTECDGGTHGASLLWMPSYQLPGSIARLGGFFLWVVDKMH